MHKFTFFECCHLFPPMSEVFFSTDLCRHHTFCGGVSRVVRAMAEKTRSRSPARAPVPDERPGVAVPRETPEAVEPQGSDGDGKLPELRGDATPKGDEVPEGPPAEGNQESTGRAIVNTLLSATKSLEACVEKLEANTSLLENVQSDSQSIQSLVAGVNYYASTTKASQAAQNANHKQVAWDWLSSSTDKTPLKESLKSIAYQSQCASKAAYKMVETASNILGELKSHKTVMEEQCVLMKTIAANQVELSKLLKSAIVGEKPDSPPSGGSAAGGGSVGGVMNPLPPGFPPPPATFGNTMPTPYMPLSPTGAPPPPSIIHAKFWRFQPVVAPSYEPNESKNPPSAAYSGQEAPSRNPGYLEVVDEQGDKRSVSPSGRGIDQLGALNASYVPKGWMMIVQTGQVHRLYA